MAAAEGGEREKAGVAAVRPAGTTGADRGRIGRGREAERGSIPHATPAATAGVHGVDETAAATPAASHDQGLDREGLAGREGAGAREGMDGIAAAGRDRAAGGGSDGGEGAGVRGGAQPIAGRAALLHGPSVVAARRRRRRGERDAHRRPLRLGELQLVGPRRLDPDGLPRRAVEDEGIAGRTLGLRPRKEADPVAAPDIVDQIHHALRHEHLPQALVRRTVADRPGLAVARRRRIVGPVACRRAAREVVFLETEAPGTPARAELPQAHLPRDGLAELHPEELAKLRRSEVADRAQLERVVVAIPAAAGAPGGEVRGHAVDGEHVALRRGVAQPVIGRPAGLEVDRVLPAGPQPRRGRG